MITLAMVHGDTATVSASFSSVKMPTYDKVVVKIKAENEPELERNLFKRKKKIEEKDKEEGVANEW